MNYRMLLCVINEHTVSTVTARYALSLATACKAGLVLYAAAEDGTDEDILLRSARHMDRLYKAASELGIPVSRVTESGKIGALLPQRVLVEKADLVLYPLTPYKRFGTDPQRNMIHNLLRTIRSDLAIMRIITLARPHPRHILVPLGPTISDIDRRLGFVSDLASCFQARVTLFHLSARRDSPDMPDDILRFRKQLEQQQVEVCLRNGSGRIGRAINVEAVTRQNDLVILGTSRRGVLGRLFFGNPAGDVMQLPTCNTILFQGAH
jgi:nucleotide-binding universal stress UspA family protein